MRPYYSSGGITIYHGDCRDVLPCLERESVDLIVSDPPYGVQWRSGWPAEPLPEMAGDHSSELAVEALRLALPVLRQKRHIYLFGRYDLTSLRVREPVELVWDKGHIGAGDLELPWGVQHEYIQFTRSKHRPSDDDEIGRLAARLRRGSILRYPRLNGFESRHPSEKPVGLLRELIESSSCLGETVLDFCAGVGSTLVAARLEGRSAIGIEIEERYAEIAVNRLAQGVLEFA